MSYGVIRAPLIVAPPIPLVIPGPLVGGTPTTVTFFSQVACKLPGNGNGILFQPGVLPYAAEAYVSIRFSGTSSYYYVYQGATVYSIYGPSSVTNLTPLTQITATFYKSTTLNSVPLGVTLVPQVP